MRLTTVLGSAVALSFCAVGALAPGSAQASGPAWRSGAFTVSGDPADLASFADWRHRAATSVDDYFEPESWGLFENPAWLAKQWAAHPSVQLSLAVPAWPTGVDGSLAVAAGTHYDHYYETFARELVSHGESHAVLRFAWEFNGNWFPWSVNGFKAAAEYAQMWRNFVNSVDSVKGAHFSFDWSISNGVYDGATYLDAAYPGNRYVTYIGDDVFDWDWNRGGHNTPAERWADLRSGSGDGLNWQVSFAAAHGKLLSFPEWGEAIRDSDGMQVGGGDDPTFVASMEAWFASHHTGYEDYFDADLISSGEYHKITDGRFDSAASRYRQLF